MCHSVTHDVRSMTASPLIIFVQNPESSSICPRLPTVFPWWLTCRESYWSVIWAASTTTCFLLYPPTPMSLLEPINAQQVWVMCSLHYRLQPSMMRWIISLTPAILTLPSRTTLSGCLLRMSCKIVWLYCYSSLSSLHWVQERVHVYALNAPRLAYYNVY